MMHFQSEIHRGVRTKDDKEANHKLLGNEGLEESISQLVEVAARLIACTIAMEVEIHVAGGGRRTLSASSHLNPLKLYLNYIMFILKYLFILFILIKFDQF